MNVSLHRELEFLAGFYIPPSPKEKFQCNRYKILLHLITTTDNFYEINVAMDRVKAMLHYEFFHTVFVNSQHQTEIEQMRDLGINVTTLPEEPLDQIIGIMLYCKFNAIMEQRMQITQLDIASDLGDIVWYQHFSDDNIGPFAADGWWHCAGCQHSDVIKENSQVSVIPAGAWTQYDLAWPEQESDRSDTVIYADFQRREN